MSIEEILEALRAIVDAAEGRDLTDEEAERYEKLEADLAVARRTKQIKERQQAYETPVSTTSIPGPEAKSDPHAQERAQAFDRYIRTGDKAIAAEFQTRDQTVGTGSEGGFLAPEEFRTKLVERLLSFGGLAAEAETITTSTGNRLPWPTLDDTANEGEIAAEGAAGAAGADLAFGEKELNAFKYVAPGVENGGLRVSVELAQDSAFDIQSMVVRALGTRLARAQAAHWVTGTGSGQPTGITNPAADHTFATGSVTTVTKDDIINLLHTLDPAYRASAAWLINDATLAEVRKLEDGNGRPLWTPFATSGLETMPGGILLGHRVVIDQAMPTMAANAKSWVFGDLRQAYVVRRVRDVQLVVDPFTRAANGQVLYTVWLRADGTPQDDNAFVIGANSAT